MMKAKTFCRGITRIMSWNYMYDHVSRKVMLSSKLHENNCSTILRSSLESEYFKCLAVEDDPSTTGSCIRHKMAPSVIV